MRSLLAVFAVCAVLVGCSDGGHPAAIGVGVESAPAQIPIATPSTERCEPGTTRECHVHYVLDNGYRYCPPDVELCRPDGLGYYPCGSQALQLDGGYAPRDAGAE
jgi:hypothetical protein